MNICNTFITAPAMLRYRLIWLPTESSDSPPSPLSRSELSHSIFLLAKLAQQLTARRLNINEGKMNKTTLSTILGMGFSALLLAGSASAASWQDQLSSAASQLSQQNNSNTSATNSTAQNGGLSLGSLTGLLNGGDKAVSANSMTNAAGVMQYCVQHNVVDNNVKSVKEQVLDKLGLSTQTAQTQNTDYQQGIAGLLNTGNGQQLNLQSLSNSPMGEKLKTKACDVVLKQGKKYIGM